MLDFPGRQVAAEDGAFAVGQPLLENLGAAEFVAPDRSGDVAPEGGVAQVDVEDAPALRDAAPLVPRGPQLSIPLVVSRGINETDFISYTQCRL